jgi:hypothetical protein
VDYAKNFFLGVSAGFVENLNVIVEVEEQKIKVASSYWQQHREESQERSVFPYCSMFYNNFVILMKINWKIQIVVIFEGSIDSLPWKFFLKQFFEL